MNKTQIKALNSMVGPTKVRENLAGVFYEYDNSLCLINQMGTIILKINGVEDKEFIRNNYAQYIQPNCIKSLDEFFKFHDDYTTVRPAYNKSDILDFDHSKDSVGRDTVDFMNAIGLDYIINRKFLRQVLDAAKGSDYMFGYSKKRYSPLRIVTDNFEAYIFPIVRKDR